MTRIVCGRCGSRNHHTDECAIKESIEHPSHYTKGKFETIDIIEDIIQHYNNVIIGSLIWQVLKYVARAPLKTDLVEDLKKARWYLDRAISQAEKRAD